MCITDTRDLNPQYTYTMSLRTALTLKTSRQCMRTIARTFRATLPLFGALTVVLLIAVVIEASDNFTVNYGTTQTITALSVCRQVTNSSGTGLSVYVPTQTAAEWSSFYTNPPAGVGAVACNVACNLPWGGTIADGQSVTAYAASSVACGSSAWRRNAVSRSASGWS